MSESFGVQCSWPLMGEEDEGLVELKLSFTDKDRIGLKLFGHLIRMDVGGEYWLMDANDARELADKLYEFAKNLESGDDNAG